VALEEKRKRGKVTSKDYERFVKALALISLLPGMEDLSEPQIELYFRMLQDLEIEDLERAIYEIIKGKQRPKFPLIGEIRAKVKLEIREEVEGEALEAWSKALSLSESSRYPTKDEMLEETIKLAFGSWQDFGRTDRFHEVQHRQHFLRCYFSIAIRRIKSDRKELGFRNVSGLLDREKEE
jgi:hypothetical protein